MRAAYPAGRGVWPARRLNIDTPPFLGVVAAVLDVRRHSDRLRTFRNGVGPDLGRHAQSHRAWRHLHVVGHHGAGADERAAAYDGTVQNDRTGPDERVVLDRAALQVGDVTDDTVRPDPRRGFRGGVDDSPVLNRSAGADEYRSVVTTQHRTRPDGGFRVDVHVADDHGIRMHERRGIDHWHPVTEGIDGHVSSPLPPTSMGAHRGRSGVLQVHAGTVRGAVTQNSPQKVGTTRDLAVL